MKSIFSRCALAGLVVLFAACSERKPEAATSPGTPAAKPVAPPAEPAAPATPAPGSMAAVFADMLVDGTGKPMGVENLAKAKYVAVYFSAHWCPPCRAFTPKLVEFTEANRKDGNFDVVLVSSDHTEKAMLGYLTETKMPWGGVYKKGGKLSPDFGKDVTGIPHLRVFDAAGKIVIDTNYKEKVYPQTVLDKLQELLQQK